MSRHIKFVDDHIGTYRFVFHHTSESSRDNQSLDDKRLAEQLIKGSRETEQPIEQVTKQLRHGRGWHDYTSN